MRSDSNYIMDLQKAVPLVIYDDQCYLCVKFAKMVNFLAKGKLPLVGHYSSFGEKLRKEILGSNGLDMFWFVDKETAYGGRAALLPLLKAIISSKGNENDFSFQENCNVGCKTAKAVFLRSSSLLSNSKKIKIK